MSASRCWSSSGIQPSDHDPAGNACGEVSDEAGLVCVREMTGLRSIDLSFNVKITSAGVAELLKA